MKMKRMLAVLLTALFLVPFFPARGEDAAAFEIDDAAVLKGMGRSWRQGYEPVIRKGQWSMILPVRSGAAAGEIQAELVTPADQLTLFKPTAKKAVSARKETGDTWGVHFVLDVYPDLKNADYPCTIRLTGKDSAGKELAAEFPYVIRIRGEKGSIEKPKIEITDVRAELCTGEEGEVRVTLTNPCRATIAEDIEMKISDSAGHILPRGPETLKAGTLPIGESITVSYPVTVIEKAAVAPHVLKLELAWTALGQSASLTENNTVAVRQEIRLEQGGLKMAPAVTAGDSVALTLPVMNMGKADLVNVLATLVLPGITERQSVLVGTLQPGETKQAQMTVTPARDITGDFTGTLAVECTDQDGNPASFWLPVNLKVEKPAAAEPGKTGPGETKTADKPTALTWILGGGCGLLLMLLMIQSLVLHGKLRRLEEERL